MPGGKDKRDITIEPRDNLDDNALKYRSNEINSFDADFSESNVQGLTHVGLKK